MYVHDDERPSLVPYIVASLVLHLLLIIFVPGSVATPAWKEKVVEVFPVFEKNQAHEIVDIDRPATEKRPKKARFLGMYDSSVEQETVAPSVRQKSEAGGKKQEAGKEEGERAEKMPEAKSEKLEFGGAKESRKKSLYNVDRKLFAMKTPDIESKAASGAQAALQDYYPDYKLGTKTYLNVLRYPDVDYFVRMKRQFKMTFNPVAPLQQYFSMNRVTRGSVEVVLAVSVGPEGNLTELFVLNSSGIPGYDREAMRTIKSSAPFAAPPSRFLADDGLLRMSWTFTVYL